MQSGNRINEGLQVLARGLRDGRESELIAQVAKRVAAAGDEQTEGGQDAAPLSSSLRESILQLVEDGALSGLKLLARLRVGGMRLRDVVDFGRDIGATDFSEMVVELSNQSVVETSAEGLLVATARGKIILAAIEEAIKEKISFSETEESEH